MFTTILVPVDTADVETAQPALARAVEMARIGDGTIRLIHVRSRAPAVEFLPPGFEEAQQAKAETVLAELAAAAGLPAERVSTVVRLGSIYHEVLQEAEAIGADLIVIGSHRPSMTTYLLGSNAATIVRHATCSVLVVRA